MIIHPPTQETMALAVEECVAPVKSKTTLHQSRFGGFHLQADDPPKPWRRWVWLLGTTSLPGGSISGFKYQPISKECEKNEYRCLWVDK